jgi:hypothetical protein
MLIMSLKVSWEQNLWEQVNWDSLTSNIAYKCENKIWKNKYSSGIMILKHLGVKSPELLC